MGHNNRIKITKHTTNKMDGSIIVTYRCPMRCKMCNIWDNPTTPSEEFKPELLEKLPKMRSVNITGGEPFVRDDIEEIVKILLRL